MATIVLSTVGGLIGGPIGATIGAALGQQLDRRLIGSRGRKGPRLNELAVQTSSYGTPLPKLFGINRVSGTVIWSTDLRETKKKVSNGKGQPKTTVFSYSASFAVALSARRIVRVERIWADGNLLRGAAGDFKTQTGFRLYTGDERQLPDPLIASAQGMATTPAYRGVGYVVFEDFQLGEYGNRIPSLSFEVIADEAPVSLGAIVETLAEGGLTADWPAVLAGVAVSGEDLRGLIETFTPLLPANAREADGRLAIETATPAAVALADDDLGATAEDERKPRIERERQALDNEPRAIAVAHYEPARDFQQGLQRANNASGKGRELRLDLPAAADGAFVKACAAGAIVRGARERSTATVRLPWRALALRPGSIVMLPGDSRPWRIETLVFERMALVAQLRALAADDLAPLAADGGVALPAPDLPHGPTQLTILDLPPLDDAVASAPRIGVAAAGSLPGWRAAGLLTSNDAGESWIDAGVTAAPAIVGTALEALPAAPAQLSDRRNSVELELLSSAMILADADEDALDRGENLAMLGNELIQFATAAPTIGLRYRLSGLRRGRRASEWAIGAHIAGERFVLLEPESLAPLAVPAGAATVAVMAVGVGDLTPPVETLAITGEAVRPLPVSHLIAEGIGGDTVLRWTRRSRNGWAWSDGVDAPLVEESERFRVDFAFDNGVTRFVEAPVSGLTYTAAERAGDIANGATEVAISVVQLGTAAASRASIITISLT